jgi:RimJ/RimL family protein N-acetyltransferase
VTFHPAGAAPPVEHRTPRLVLRPLRASDVATDYEAVMSSAAALRRWSQSEWPAEDFTLAENLEDLRRHEREHLEGQAFTYTVLDPAESRCLGCVYVVPLRSEEAAWSGSAAQVARVAFWVRTSEIATDLDRHLLGVLREWFRESWRFERVVFSASPADARQLALFGEAGMIPLGVVRRADGRLLSAHLGS